MQRMRIEICGGIAAGKTTLARLLKSLPARPVLERFRENPFWRAFYANPGAHAFETEVTFLLQHYHELKVHKGRHGTIVADFSLVQDAAYAAMGLADSQKAAFYSVLQEVDADIGAADLLIHVVCPPAVALERIRRRGRKAEARITLPFLRALDTAIEERVGRMVRRSRVVAVNSATVNYATNARERRALLKHIRQDV
jgi:deoxyadenosine/deoxycytidine kinase